MTRLSSHDKDEAKDFFTRAVVITSNDENMTKSHGRYMESRLIEMAQTTGRDSVANKTAPDTPPS